MADSEPPAPPARPRWVKVIAALAVLLIAIVVIALLAGGEHGPGRHGSTGQVAPLVLTHLR